MKKIGRYEVTAFVASRFGLDGGAMFGIVPRALWSRKMKPDAENRIQMVTRVLLLRDEERDRRILIDAGMGDKWSQKHARIYALQDMDLSAQLEAAGAPAEDITDVVVTHLHFDHAGGLTSELSMPEGWVAMPTFPNAVHHIQRACWRWAHDPSAKDAGSFVRTDFEPIEEFGRLSLLDGDCEVAPSVEVIALSGHTPGMQLVKISGPQETLLFCADLFPTRFHLRSAWNMAYDNAPLETVEEKGRILRKAKDGGWLLVLEHDPDVAALRVKESKRGWDLQPAGDRLE
jgi:glyoxylase-like metal-dependent hydrolase (beta-lactamase superfamily II)